MSKKVQEFITKRVVDLIETSAKLKRAQALITVIQENLPSNKPYRGVNQVITSLAAMVSGFTSPYWLTIKQILDRNGRIKRVQFSKWTPVVIWKEMTWRAENDNGDQEDRSCLMPCRFFKIWDIEQTTLEIPKITEKNLPLEPLEAVEQIIHKMKHPVEIRHGGKRAYYSPSLDYIQLPNEDYWENSLDKAMTILHELAHSTAYETRLDRRMAKSAAGRDDAYGEEELVAELAVAMVMSKLGLGQSTVRSSATYCTTWLSVLRNDSRAIFRISGQSQKAADYLTWFLNAETRSADDNNAGKEGESDQ